MLGNTTHDRRRNLAEPSAMAIAMTDSARFAAFALETAKAMS